MKADKLYLQRDFQRYAESLHKKAQHAIYAGFFVGVAFSGAVVFIVRMLKLW
jgi:hypothetical protein